MRIAIHFLAVFLLFLLAQTSVGQILIPATWSYAVSKEQVKTGEQVDLIFKAKIIPDWYLYSSDFDPDLGPQVTEFTFKPHESYELVGKIKPINPKKKYDDLWGGDYTYFVKNGEFRQTVKILKANPVIKGSYSYQVCTDIDGKCIPFEDDFSFTNIKVLAGAGAAAPAKTTTPAEPKKQPAVTQNLAQKDTQTTRPDSLAAPKDGAEVDLSDSGSKITSVVDTANGQIAADAGNGAITTETETAEAGAGPVKISLWAFMLLAFGSGLVALLTPCVFPMIPMTVSYFTSGSSSRGQAISKAAIYGFSIVAIYTLIGTIVAKLAGPDAANFLSTHWLPNIFFFLIFLLFGMSFLGMFEITLPNSLVNKIDRQADKGGYYGIFFMAFTLVLVSFSCTGPIVGTILVESANGQTLRPIAGMFAFSMAFAIPFSLFAAFPGMLSGLPKSGGWLNSVKVVLGFLELALALKFLSIADQVYHWRILDREIYIALWIIIFALLGFYLLGKIKLPHDSDLKHISVPRLLMATVTFAFVVYLVPGMFGAPLKALSGYLPPQSSLDFDFTRLLRESTAHNNANPAGNNAAMANFQQGCEQPKYADFLHLPHGIQGYYDLDQALDCAKKVNKPVFIDFTGHGCVNCREMEANVWSNPEVLRRLKNDYVVVALYVDDKTELPEKDWYVSPYDNKEKTTIGRQNADYQIRKFNMNAQPYYVLMGHNGEPLVTPQAYNLNVQNFVDYLDSGLEAFRKANSLSVAVVQK